MTITQTLHACPCYIDQPSLRPELIDREKKLMPINRPPAGAKIIRVSSRFAYRKCRRAWAYEYRDKLEPREAKSAARDLGTALHRALEAFYLAAGTDMQDRVDLLWQGWVTNSLACSDEDRDLGVDMLAHYIKHYGADQEICPVHVERTFFAKIPGTTVWLQGTPDIVGYHGSHGLHVIDHKGFRQPLRPEEIEHDDQMTSYMWLLAQQNPPIKVQGGLYNMLRKSAVAIPKLLKSGKLSRDLGIRTTPVVYLQTLQEHGLDEAEYEDHIAAIPDGDFFRRETLTRSKAEMAAFERDLTFEAREMMSTRTDIRPVNSPRVCRYCDYKSLCRAQTTGGDVELVKRIDYQPKRDDREPKIAIFEGE